MEIRPTKGQVDDLIEEIRGRAEADQRVLVTTLTKKMAEDLTDYLVEMGIRVRYLHSEVDLLQRIEIVRDLRLGEFDVLVGINLLREGLDLPEVSLVAILDADKEGFLRSETSLVQTIGRAARNVDGTVLMYADAITDSMKAAISETQRRRQIQLAYNTEHGIDPQTIRRKVNDILLTLRGDDGERSTTPKKERRREAVAPGDAHRRARAAHRLAWRTRCTRPPRTSASNTPRACAMRSRTSARSSRRCARPASASEHPPTPRGGPRPGPLGSPACLTRPARAHRVARVPGDSRPTSRSSAKAGSSRRSGRVHPVPADVEVLAVGGFLMPAAADRHVHIGLSDPAAVLRRGVTAVRDLAWPADRIFPLADASELSSFNGPLVRAAGPMLTAPGGYPSHAAWAPAGTARELDGPEDAAAAVGELVALGAAVVKVSLNAEAGPTPTDAELAGHLRGGARGRPAGHRPRPGGWAGRARAGRRGRRARAHALDATAIGGR